MEEARDELPARNDNDIADRQDRISRKILESVEDEIQFERDSDGQRVDRNIAAEAEDAVDGRSPLVDGGAGMGRQVEAFGAVRRGRGTTPAAPADKGEAVSMSLDSQIDRREKVSQKRQLFLQRDR